MDKKKIAKYVGAGLAVIGTVLLSYGGVSEGEVVSIVSATVVIIGAITAAIT